MTAERTKKVVCRVEVGVGHDGIIVCMFIQKHGDTLDGSTASPDANDLAPIPSLIANQSLA